MRFPERECSDQDHFAQNLVLVKEKLGPELTRVGHCTLQKLAKGTKARFKLRF